MVSSSVFLNVDQPFGYAYKNGMNRARTYGYHYFTKHLDFPTDAQVLQYVEQDLQHRFSSTHRANLCKAANQAATEAMWAWDKKRKEERVGLDRLPRRKGRWVCIGNIDYLSPSR